MTTLAVNLVFTCFLAVSARPVEPNDMIILGTVEDKTYVTDLIPRNWDASLSFCESEGMSLATITSESQAEFVKCAYDPINFNGYYWMGARTNESWSRWGPRPKWRDSDELVQKFERVKLTEWNDDYRHNNCLVYDADNRQNGQYLNRPCENEYFTLCESSQPLNPMQKTTETTMKTNPNLIELGTFGGKTYFGDNGNRTWIESMAFCKRNGLLQATIRGGYHEEFLKSACAKVKCDDWFWTAKTEWNSGFKRKCFERLELCPYFDANRSHDSVGVATEKHYTLCETVEYTPFTVKREWGSDDFSVGRNLEVPNCPKGFIAKAVNSLHKASIYASTSTMPFLSADQQKFVFDIVKRMGLLK